MGVIPYLGTFLTDLTMTHTAFPDFIRTMVHVAAVRVGNWVRKLSSSQSLAGEEMELVNFDKRRKEFHILAQLGLYQKSASQYSFPHNPSLVQWLGSASTLSPQQRCAPHTVMRVSKVLIGCQIFISHLPPP